MDEENAQEGHAWVCVLSFVFFAPVRLLTILDALPACIDFGNFSPHPTIENSHPTWHVLLRVDG